MEPYSYHTFFFPFVWKKETVSEYKKYVAMFPEQEWKDISIKSYTDINSGDDYDLTPSQKYQVMQFFTEAAREALFDWKGNDFVKYLSYRPEYIRNQNYFISIDEIINEGKDNEKTSHYEYSLPINGIKIRIFNTGIAILAFELENIEYRCIEDVKRINQYGRRIFPPYLKKRKRYRGEDSPAEYEGDPEEYCGECATEIRITGFDAIDRISKTKPENEIDCIPNFIRAILPYSDVKTAIDDRMFVACVVADRAYMKYIRDYYKISGAADEDKLARCLSYKNMNEAAEAVRIEDKKKNKADKTQTKQEEKPQEVLSERDLVIKKARDLYELIFVDNPGCCSCQSLAMLDALLKKSIYDRWEEYGTIYGMSNHSLICIHNDVDPEKKDSDDISFLSFNFISIYTHMVEMVLAQRAAIIVFDEYSSGITKHFGTHSLPGNFWNLAKKIFVGDEIADFQKKYIDFCNQHNNIEITCQEQGVELYAMLQNAMYVPENSEKLEKEVSALYEAASTSSDLNIAAIGLIFAVIVAACDFDSIWKLGRAGILLAFVIIGCVVPIICKEWKRKKQERSKNKIR